MSASFELRYAHERGRALRDEAARERLARLAGPPERLGVRRRVALALLALGHFLERADDATADGVRRATLGEM